jgi:DoxX-like family
VNKALWIVQVLLALAFAGSGGMKLATAPADLRANPAMGWSTQYTDGQIKAIGAAEVAGAIGLIAPAATGIMPVLTPIAGAALSVLMSGAAVVHLQRDEPPIAPIVLSVLSLAVCVLRLRRARTTPART